MSDHSFSFTNATSKDLPVMAPAFSLTKVMIFAGPLLAAVITGLAQALEKLLNLENDIERPPLTNTEMLILFIASIGFFAIVISADMISRGIAASAQHLGASSVSAAGSRARFVRLPHAMPASLTRKPPGARGTPKEDQVQVVAITVGEPPSYLCLHNDANKSLSWHSKEDLHF